MKDASVVTLIEKHGQIYSEFLGINLDGGKEKEIFKWFLAAVLFGAPITETSVVRTYKCFEKHGVLSPEKIIETGWNGLVEILDEGSYRRYDYKTANKLLEVMKNLKTNYAGSLNLLHEKSVDSLDLEKRLRELGKGIGEITVCIFLRELRGKWSKADSKPTSLVILAAKSMGIIENDNPEKALKELKEFWNRNKVEGKSFINFETALVRLGKEIRRTKKTSLRLY